MEEMWKKIVEKGDKVRI
jgi:hypothetical protein